eukprot:comp22194_c3_seq1/m.32623 comp22194_c3_seq1/g.32623  ORF comp22194_c3_seq1/g.32623 comp22194_c3_seq1/m.32623 type:complete len:338 (-) comp22194_c3_seq1:240-1253(-)
MTDSDEPKFGSDAEAAAYWKKLYEDKEDELQEYKLTSAELETELEAELDQKDGQLKELRRQFDRMEKEYETTKERLAAVQREGNTTISALQEELTVLKQDHQQLMVSVRKLEQRNDDVERSERVYQSSVDDLEEKLEKVVERNAFLEYENNALEIELQHLREELRDSQTELAVLKNQPRPPSPQPMHIERQRTGSEPPTLAMMGITSSGNVGKEQEAGPGRMATHEEEAQGANKAESDSGRRRSGTALGLVNDILLRVMSLEKRLSSCRNFIRPTSTPSEPSISEDAAKESTTTLGSQASQETPISPLNQFVSMIKNGPAAGTPIKRDSMSNPATAS